MPNLGLSAWSYRTPKRPLPHVAAKVLDEAVLAAGWPGTVLPAAQVLGVVVHPVVDFTGAAVRVAAGSGPQRCLATLEMWETWPAGDGWVSAAPLRIVGFISTAPRWPAAVTAARTVGGLGAGMVLRERRPEPLQLLDADATGVWAVGADRPSLSPSLWVRGRVGPLPTATRVPATRLVEEGLFAHALDCGVLS